MTPWLFALAAAEPKAVQIAWVDLERAIVGTEAGQRIKATLSGEHQRLVREIRGKEERLIYEKAKLGPARYAEEVEKLQAEIGKRQDELEKKQDGLLAPIVDRMKRILEDHRESGAEPRIIAISDTPPVVPAAECDVTSWLIRSYAATSRLEPPRLVAPCRYTKVVYLSFDRALAASAAGKAATAELDGFEARSQVDLDRRQKELDASVSTGDRERRRDELAALYQKYQKELEEKEMAAEKRLYGRLEAEVASTAKLRPSVLFLELLDASGSRLEPSCDATEWAAKIVDGVAAELDAHCR